VLLVDFDIREPALADRLDLTRANDLGSLLDGGLALADVCARVEGNPRLLAAAAPREADPSTVDRLSLMAPDLLAKGRALADWVVVDGPPLSQAGDVLAVGHACDHLLLVSRLGHTEEAALAAARELLQPLSLTPTGHVLIGAGGAGYTSRERVSRALSPGALRQQAGSR
jgi:Mrp family chromosome partitioning ATPase